MHLSFDAVSEMKLSVSILAQFDRFRGQGRNPAVRRFHNQRRLPGWFAVLQPPYRRADVGAGKSCASSPTSFARASFCAYSLSVQERARAQLRIALEGRPKQVRARPHPLEIWIAPSGLGWSPRRDRCSCSSLRRGGRRLSGRMNRYRTGHSQENENFRQSAKNSGCRHADQMNISTIAAAQAPARAEA